MTKLQTALFTGTLILAAVQLSSAQNAKAADAKSNFDRWWTPATDATTAAPGNHKVLFENDEVRVLEVTVQPGTKEPMHAHRYPAVIYLQSSPKMAETQADGTHNDMGIRPDGLVRYLPIAQGHSLENLDSTKLLKAIRVELKKER